MKTTAIRPSEYHTVDPIKGKHAVFCLIYCRNTDRFLFEQRSKDVNNGLEWGLFGGGVDSGETLLEAMLRELREEAGFRFRGFDYATTKLYGKRITIFVKILNRELVPRLSWESSNYRWIQDLDDVRPLHKKMAKRYNELRRLMEATREAGKSQLRTLIPSRN